MRSCVASKHWQRRRRVRSFPYVSVHNLWNGRLSGRQPREPKQTNPGVAESPAAWGPLGRAWRAQPRQAETDTEPPSVGVAERNGVGERGAGGRGGADSALLAHPFGGEGRYLQRPEPPTGAPRRSSSGLLAPADRDRPTLTRLQTSDSPLRHQSTAQKIRRNRYSHLTHSLTSSSSPPPTVYPAPPRAPSPATPEATGTAWPEAERLPASL